MLSKIRSKVQTIFLPVFSLIIPIVTILFSVYSKKSLLFIKYPLLNIAIFLLAINIISMVLVNFFKERIQPHQCEYYQIYRLCIAGVLYLATDIYAQISHSECVFRFSVELFCSGVISVTFLLIWAIYSGSGKSLKESIINFMKGIMGIKNKIYKWVIISAAILLLLIWLILMWIKRGW